MTKEKQERLQNLLKQIEMPPDLAEIHFTGGSVEKFENWKVHFHLPKIMPVEIFQHFHQRILHKYEEAKQIQYTLTYDEVISLKEKVGEYWDFITTFIAPKMTKLLIKMDQISVEGNKVHFHLLNSFTHQMIQDQKIDEAMMHIIPNFFGLNVEVEFTVSEKSKIEEEKKVKEPEKPLNEKEVLSFTPSPVQEPKLAPIEEKERNLEKKSSEESKEKQEIKQEEKKEELKANIPLSVPKIRIQSDFDIIMGSKISQEPMPIYHVQKPMGSVCIQGYVFGTQIKDLKNGLYKSCKFYLSDYSDSILCKIFASTNRRGDVRKVKAMEKVQDGMWIRLTGFAKYDEFEKQLVVEVQDMSSFKVKEREDNAAKKRVEWHLHTQMSTNDALHKITKYIERAAKWGHPAIAMTDHGNVHEFHYAQEASKKHGIKMIYGMEVNVYDDKPGMVLNPKSIPLKGATYVTFDVETTGFSVRRHEIIELAAVKVKDGVVIDRFETLVNPRQDISEIITGVTGITNDMVIDVPFIEEVLPRFIEWVGKDSILVAHNAKFDQGMFTEKCERLGLQVLDNPYLDTLELARFLRPNLKNHQLGTLAKSYDIPLVDAHRAMNDAKATGEMLVCMLQELSDKGIENLAELNDSVDKKFPFVRYPYHYMLWAKNPIGKKNLFKLVSMSHTDHYHSFPRIPKSVLEKYREGLLIGSSCSEGELYQKVLNKGWGEIVEAAQFCDVLEIQPHTYNLHLIPKNVENEEVLKQVNRDIIKVAKELGKPVIATGNVHYLDPHHKESRNIVINGITKFNQMKERVKAKKMPNAHFRTTDEMLAEFDYLGEELAYEVVVENTNQLLDEIEDFDVFIDQLFAPVIENSDVEIREKCFQKAREWYGDNLPSLVEERLEKELKPIINYNFAGIYLISERLVKKSNEDGYLVGSRGSVGSSVVATFLGVSEVNPLPPHYRCPSCRHNEWFLDGSVRNGFDLPDKNCPECGTLMIGTGHDIPFETFLGFKGDKVPDIDLNFSNQYQASAHNFTKVMFGENNVFRAGTVGTVADKTAYGFTRKYAEEVLETELRHPEILRRAESCVGVKRSTGQHPGGIVVLPEGMEIEDITPVQYPADNTESEWKTTHFDYHAFDKNLLKLDILGHDDPTMMRMLFDLTGVNPETIPMNDPLVMSLFNSTNALGVTAEQIKRNSATYGIPEFGTPFVGQMVDDTKPAMFSDLVQISGLSHGTDVWLNNAHELIKQKTCTIQDVIGCRDDIMVYLMYKGLEPSLAFKIMEGVRKGKGLTEEWIQIMKSHHVPDWYIWSCGQIKYMFPKAHAAAYVTFAVRTMFYKLYYPIEFYAAYFSIRIDEFDVRLALQGYDAVRKRLEKIKSKGNDATPKEDNLATALEMCLEMLSRGFSFQNIDLNRSDSNKFLIDGKTLIPPFRVLEGVGSAAAISLAETRDENPYVSIDDLAKRAKVSVKVIERLKETGCLDELPESDQLEFSF